VRLARVAARPPFSHAGEGSGMRAAAVEIGRKVRPWRKTLIRGSAPPSPEREKESRVDGLATIRIDLLLARPPRGSLRNPADRACHSR
jgi:hypothetical protein